MIQTQNTRVSDEKINGDALAIKAVTGEVLRSDRSRTTWKTEIVDKRL